MAKTWNQKLLQPCRSDPHWSGTGICLLLALSLGVLLLAPVLMPEGYTWLFHTTSEAAAQGLQGAWLMRLGFLLFGFAVLWLTLASDTVWARATTWMHLAFGILMISTAAFSHRPFIAGVPFDPVEDLLHSITATLMGFAFSFGVLARFLQRHKKNSVAAVLDLIAVLAAVVFPLLMAAQPAWAGLFQRLMFFTAYAWYGKEAYTLHIAD
jgi:hypothetical protein